MVKTIGKVSQGYLSLHVSLASHVFPSPERLISIIKSFRELANYHQATVSGGEKVYEAHKKNPPPTTLYLFARLQPPINSAINVDGDGEGGAKLFYFNISGNINKVLSLSVFFDLFSNSPPTGSPVVVSPPAGL